MPESRNEKASYLALLAMTRLFLGQKIHKSPNLNPRFIQVLEDFLAQGVTNPEDIRPQLQRIEAFLSASI
jgi:hypothetical protein